MRCARGHRLDGARPVAHLREHELSQTREGKADKAKKPRGGAKKTATKKKTTAKK